ncbi:MAG: S8 family peptidase [Chitinophagaceae bacterium]|nr:S8 family peptidase [Chitinophagaceae bacterium]
MKKQLYVLFASLLAGTLSFGQSATTSVPENWHQLDRSATGYYGISLDKAYSFIKTKKLKSKQVLVAVIDSGIDTLHEDLKPVLWTNPKEIPFNGIDDDNNGYVDDVHGWNFLGGKDGRNVTRDSYEAARVYNSMKTKYGTLIPDESSVSDAEKGDIEVYKKAQQKIVGDANQMEIAFIKRMLPVFLKGDSVVMKEMGKEEYGCKDLENYTTANSSAKFTKMYLLELCKENNSDEISNSDIKNQFESTLKKAEAAEIAPEAFRKDVVKDNEADINDRFYGNNDIMTSTSMHGTHCSGIIAGVRNNEKGGDGIADNVRIMMLRAVPDGDEHDKDIALAIRYAVDNGAQVISMSFGKDFSPEKQWVDDAVKYAEKKGVLLVHAAGNDSKNIDSTDNFPTVNFLGGKRANNWIKVGASGDPMNGGITANFSNYGKRDVDVFAPGVRIFATLPGGNRYGKLSGTSMACPVVAGTAALLLEYFPTLSAKQVKYVIEKSATTLDIDVNIPGTTDKVKLGELSKTGGLLNAFEAVKLASTLKGERTVKKEVLPKPKLTKNKKG